MIKVNKYDIKTFKSGNFNKFIQYVSLIILILTQATNCVLFRYLIFKNYTYIPIRIGIKFKSWFNHRVFQLNTAKCQ